MLTPGHQRVDAGGDSHGHKGRKRQAGDVGHILFFVAVIPAFAEDVDSEEGEHGEAQPVVPGRNIPVHGACKQKTQHGHQELTGPGGQGELDSVAQTLFLNEQTVGERHDESVHGEGERQEYQVGKRHAHCGEAL